MARTALLRTAGVAIFAIAWAAPWQYEADLVAFVAELVDADVVPVAGRIERLARNTPNVASSPPVAPSPEPVRTHWTVEVVTVPAGSEDHAARTLAARPQTAPAPRDRAGLALALQRELRRVGCYDGELNGAWTPTTRRAMLAFTQRMNAVLPTEQPDHILLALVQGQETKACGVACPAAQALGPDGRCTPAALLAVKKPPSAAKAGSLSARPAPAVISWSSTVRIETGTAATQPQGSLAGPMGLAGPRAAADAPSARPSATSRPAGPVPRPPAREPGFGPSSLRQLDGTGF